jgi:BrnA antitoxin of type II toxin-antitoxin system
MKSEYDFSQGKRGAIDPIQPEKTLITIALDDEILEWLRSRVHAAGGGNYQALLNQALHSYIQDRADLLEDEKELVFIFNTLINFIGEPSQKSSSKKSSLLETLSSLGKWIWSKLWVESHFWWEKPSLSCFVISIILLLFNKNQDSQLFKIIQIILLTVMLISYFLFSITKFIMLIKNRKTTPKVIQENLERNKKETLNEKLIVLELSKKSKENLKFSKTKIIDLIEDWQEHYETVDKLTPLIAFLIMLIPILIYGIPIDLKQTIYYVAAGLIISTIIRPGLEFIGKLASRNTIYRFKRCLLLLEEAQAMAEAIEFNENSTQSK